MQVILYALAAIALLYGAAISMGAKSAIHEIQASVSFIVFAVLLSGGGIISAIERLRSQSSGAAVESDPKRFP